MESDGSTDFSKLLLKTIEQENISKGKQDHANYDVACPDAANKNIARSAFEQQMYQLLSQNNNKLPLRQARSQMEDGPIMKSFGVDMTSSSEVDARDPGNQRQQVEGNAEKDTHDTAKDDGHELEHYYNFLCEVSSLGTIKFVAQCTIKKTRLSPYGIGASMTVYPGLWSEKMDNGSTTKEIVAIKYCNITPPQGASSLRDCRNQISSRLKSVLYELKVMSNGDTRHGDIFPEVYAMSWEDCRTPAGITIYQPILIVEPAIATLEEYICNGWPPSVVRHEAEKRFIVALHSAISYLHAHCNIVHGDLKPGNILIFLNRYSGEVHAKLSDFGLAFSIYDSERIIARRENWRPLGTRYWSAPEMCLQSMSNFESLTTPYVADYYSFGLIVWFILFGYPVSESGQGVNKGDEDRFMAMKGSWGTEVQDYFEQAVSRRWRWKASDSVVRFLKKEKHLETRKKLMSVLIKVKQIQEQEWDEDKRTWTSTKSQLHHAYRGLVRMALSRTEDQRIYPCALPTSAIFEQSVAEIVSANHICGDLDYPVLDSNYSPYAARRRTEKLSSNFYLQQASKEAALRLDNRLEMTDKDMPQLKKAKARLRVLRYNAVNSIPKTLGQELLKMLVSRASDEMRPQEERVRYMNSIQSLVTQFPSGVDAKHWERQMIELGPSIHRLRHVYKQGVLRNDPVDKDLATAWILDGLSSSMTEQVDPKVQKTLNGIRHDLAERPAQVALTDWISEIGIRYTQRPTYPDIHKNPVFKCIIEGNLPELHHHLAKSKIRPSKLRYKHYNLLNFAIINRQPRICRYLCLEHNFEFDNENGGNEALEDCISDPQATILTEFDSITALLHERWLSTTPRDIDKKPLNLIIQLLYPPKLAILVQRGTTMAIELVHSFVSNPLGMDVDMMQLSWIEKFQGQDSLNPLLNALKTRRFTPFLRLLQRGHPHRALFSPNSVVFGSPILFHAIVALAPFFVAALLAYGADAKTSVDIGRINSTALQILCSEDDLEGYKKSLRRRLEFHEKCGFNELIIKRDRAEVASAEQDAASQKILIADLLISHGADLNAQSMIEEQVGEYTITVGSETPLSLAIESDNTELACFLIRKGADLTIRSMGMTPLHEAIGHDRLEIVRCLLEQGASTKDILDGLSPLAYAAGLARLEIFRFLLEAGSDLTFSPHNYGILFYQILQMSSEMCSDQEAAHIAHLSTPEERRKLRPVLAEHLKKMAPADLRVLMQLESENGAIGIHHAAMWITGRNKGDSELLSIILGNTENLLATIRTGQNAGVLATTFGNISFLAAWNTAVLSSSSI
ncbi:serine threonine kinase [Fusarium beomiforme]|uniref:Serine threonine kinase n=1 Tax=Fusarium beomiforme TaxID=44412 RepID=A0A9P5DRC3_9HYPO|nr:serine threonine kinase [Fusarium beomiforme]